MREEGQPDALEAALRRAESELGGLETTAPFTSRGFAAAQEMSGTYIRSLALEAARSAQRQGADAISRADVLVAARYLAAGTVRRSAQYAGTAGGLLLGAAISNSLNILSTESYGGGGLLITGLLLVVGAALVAFHVARDTA